MYAYVCVYNVANYFKPSNGKQFVKKAKKKAVKIVVTVWNCGKVVMTTSIIN